MAGGEELECLSTINGKEPAATPTIKVKVMCQGWGSTCQTLPDLGEDICPLGFDFVSVIKKRKDDDLANSNIWPEDVNGQQMMPVVIGVINMQREHSEGSHQQGHSRSFNLMESVHCAGNPPLVQHSAPTDTHCTPIY